MRLAPFILGTQDPLYAELTGTEPGMGDNYYARGAADTLSLPTFSRQEPGASDASCPSWASWWNAPEKMGNTMKDRKSMKKGTSQVLGAPWRQN